MNTKTKLVAKLFSEVEEKHKIWRLGISLGYNRRSCAYQILPGYKDKLSDNLHGK